MPIHPFLGRHLTFESWGKAGDKSQTDREMKPTLPDSQTLVLCFGQLLALGKGRGAMPARPAEQAPGTTFVVPKSMSDRPGDGAHVASPHFGMNRRALSPMP